MKKHSTLERLDLAREIRILALGLIGSLIMAINIKSFVHTGGLYPGGFNGVTLLIGFGATLGLSEIIRRIPGIRWLVLGIRKEKKA